ncbi:hypothetical protein ACLOJK_040244 [Asimina triloba]
MGSWISPRFGERDDTCREPPMSPRPSARLFSSSSSVGSATASESSTIGSALFVVFLSGFSDRNGSSYPQRTLKPLIGRKEGAKKHPKEGIVSVVRYISEAATHPCRALAGLPAAADRLHNISATQTESIEKAAYLLSCYSAETCVAVGGSHLIPWSLVWGKKVHNLLGNTHYHIVVNEPLESIALDLGFGGNTLAEGLVVSICLGGAFIGCLLSGWIADGIGRRRAFQLSALPMIIGAFLRKTCICSAITKSLEGMLLGRLLVGAGMGLGPPVASLYVTEVSPSFVRGTYGSFIQIATCLGLLASLFIGIPTKEFVGWYVAYGLIVNYQSLHLLTENANRWRVCFWVSAIPAAMLALGMEFCAESPHWLYKQGRLVESEAQFERLLGVSHVKSAIAELSRSDRGDEIETARFSEILHGRHFRVVFIGSTLFALQQLSGINAIFYFSTAVFKSAGVPSDVANISVGFANLLGSVIAMLLMDKLGRKVLLSWSFLGMAIAMVIQVAAASIPDHASGALFVFTFALGAGPVPGLLLPEIFPSRIRAMAMAICMCVHWVVNFFVGLLFLPMLEQLGRQLLYSMFASVCLIAVFFVKRNVVETKGRSLHEIEISLLPQQ